MRAWTILKQLENAYLDILGSKLTGIYVHGSLAFGCFRWECSDIDFLVVTEEALTLTEKESMIRVLLDLDICAPEKGFEMSVVLRSVCKPFQYPTPYELHYSNAHRASYQQDLSGTCKKLQGTDPDLAAHMTVIGKAGIVLCGKPIHTVFSSVPQESYLRSLWYDIANAPDEIMRAPVYYVLNLCRVLAYVREGLVLSKEEGGRWGMQRLLQEADLIEKALGAYCSGREMVVEEKLPFFAQKMLEYIRQNADFFELQHQN